MNKETKTVEVQEYLKKYLAKAKRETKQQRIWR